MYLVCRTTGPLWLSDYRIIGMTPIISHITSLTPPLFIELLDPVQVLPLFLQFFDWILELFRQWSFFYVSIVLHKTISPWQWPVPTSKVYVGPTVVTSLTILWTQEVLPWKDVSRTNNYNDNFQVIFIFILDENVDAHISKIN